MAKKRTNPLDPTIYERIVDHYIISGSVKRAAESAGVSEVTARRVLITEGLWSSKTSLLVRDFLRRGLTIEEIAAEMNVTRQAVEAYLPYSRGMYGVFDTEDSQHSREYRERVSDAQEAVSSLTGDVDPKQIVNAKEWNRLCFDEQVTKNLLEFARRDALAHDPEIARDIVLKLHLELVSSWWSGAKEDMDLREDEWAELLKLAKAKNGISRDILVPGAMNLHAFHYVIQKLFGWQNSHLHHFSLSPEDFTLVTADRIGGYMDLCGVLFRFPDDDLTDVYWDDDYEEGISPKSWLKKKYAPPYEDYSVGNTWIGNQWEIEDFHKLWPEFKDEHMLSDITDAMVVEEGFNTLSERLTLGELLLPNSAYREDVRDWKGEMVGRVELMKEEMDDINADTDELREPAAELRKWRQSCDQLDKMKWMYPDTYREEVEERVGAPYKEVVETHKRAVPYWTEECLEIFFDWNVPIEPYFSEFYYLYDYGDGWCIKITVEEKHITPLAGEEWNGKPVCVSADGLNLVDDCGGVGGYLDMLRTIHGPDEKEAAEMKEWAKWLGWTGRKNKPEKML